MKKGRWLWQLLYYVLIVAVYGVFLKTPTLLMGLSGHSVDLGTAMFAADLIIFTTPVVAVLLMRLSLLKWYVDPIAAALIPVFLYASMVMSQFKRVNDLGEAVLRLNQSLNGGGWWFLGGVFVLGLIASFSAARVREENLSYRLLHRWESRKENR